MIAFKFFVFLFFSFLFFVVAISLYFNITLIALLFRSPFYSALIRIITIRKPRRTEREICPSGLLHLWCNTLLYRTYRSRLDPKTRHCRITRYPFTIINN